MRVSSSETCEPPLLVLEECQIANALVQPKFLETRFALLSSVENRVLQQTGDPVVKKMQESMLKNTVRLRRGPVI